MPICNKVQSRVIKMILPINAANSTNVDAETKEHKEAALRRGKHIPVKPQDQHSWKEMGQPAGFVEGPLTRQAWIKPAKIVHVKRMRCPVARTCS